ncbi:hypothetical protein [Sphingorhabdus sp.]|uniref:hypothetical protein n=1 Tax=Sphingorhabdus sp. TaxID=1902408 RepID=UPI00333EA660
MTSTIVWEIEDDKGENDTGKPACIEFNIDFSVDPADPGYMYDSNGDGYPGHDASVNIGECTCVQVQFDGEEKSREPTAEEAATLANWFSHWLNTQPKEREQIETAALELAVTDDYEPDYEPAEENRALRGPFDHL